MKRMHTDEEIRELAANPIGDVVVDGHLTATAITPIEAEYTLDNTITYPEGIENVAGKSSYSAIKVIAGVLWLIASLSIKNVSESAFSGTLTIFSNIQIPEKYRDKIIRADGTNLTQNPVNGSLIANAPVYPINKYATIGSYSAGTINLYISTYALSANTEGYIGVRVPIMLL